MTQEVNYCQRCGGPLSETVLEDKTRPHCERCGLTVFIDPKVAAAVLVPVDGKLVMLRRANEPGIGLWSFPSGYVDRGEGVEEAAVRETKEETGLDIEITGLLGVYSGSGSPVVLVVYTAEVTGGELQPGDEAQETGLFHLDGLPELAFPRDTGIIQEWRALTAQGPR